MTDRPRYYLTTSIAYANNKPGLHTLYEVIGADVDRPLAPDARRRHPLPDRHGRALDQHRPGRRGRGPPDARVRRREGRPLPLGRGGARRSAPDRFIRTTDPDHVRAAQEMVRRAHANGDIYLGTYEGWYCPNEGFRNASDVQETAARHDLPQPSRSPAPVADRTELVLPPVGVPGTRSSATTRNTPTSSSPTTAATRCSGSSAAASRTSRSAASGRPATGASRSRSPRTARRPCARTALGPRGRQDLRLVRRAHQLHHRRRLPRRPGRVRAAGGRPTCTSSARTSPGSTRSSGRRCCGAPASTRRVSLGPRLAARGRWRADEQEPGQLPRP